MQLSPQISFAVDVIRQLLERQVNEKRTFRVNSSQISTVLSEHSLLAFASVATQVLLDAGEIEQIGDVPLLDNVWRAFGQQDTTTTPPPDSSTIVIQFQIRTSPASPKNEGEQFDAIASFATECLKGSQRRVVEVLIQHRGTCRVPDLEVEADVGDVVRTVSHVNKRLKDIGWWISRHDGSFRLKGKSA